MHDFKLVKIDESSLDASVNFIFSDSEGQYIESRFVQRDPNKFIIYLSSQTGCTQACRFCHLTQLGLNQDVYSVNMETFLLQTRTVLEYLKNTPSRISGKPTKVSFNFMARGEPLFNSLVRNRSGLLFQQLSGIAAEYGYFYQFKVSTILPNKIGLRSRHIVPYYQMIESVLNGHNYDAQLYYSLYSVNPDFRKRWIPNAISPEMAGEILYGTNDALVLHHAFIAGENDSEKDVHDILGWMQHYDIHANFNIVRYNPFSQKCGKETSDTTISKLADMLAASVYVDKLQIVPKVGFDVKASCGMFVAGE